MAITGIFSKRQPAINGIIFDSLLEEETSMDSDVSESPLEYGVVATDHIIQRPLEITMTVGVSDNFFRAQRAQATQIAFDESGSTTLSNTAGTAFGAGAGIIAGGAIGALGGAGAAVAGIGATIANGQASSRSQTVLEAIRAIQRQGLIIDIVSTKANYKNCVISRTYQRTTKENEQGLELVVELKQVLIMRQSRTGLYDRAQTVLPADDTAGFMGQLETDLGNVAFA